jgi:hypothetical protein
LIRLRFKLIKKKKKKTTNLEELEPMEYEKLHIYSKLRLWVDFLLNFFAVNGIDIHKLNLGPFRILELLVENPFKKCVSLHLFNNKCI